MSPTQIPDIAVERDVTIAARPETVFRYFTDPDRFAAWFGAGSSIDPKPGGAVKVTFPGGAVAMGEVVTVDPPRQVVFTWGYPGDDSPLPVGSSTVTIDLEPTDGGTHVSLRHQVGSSEMAEAHAAGWRHHLSHLATLAGRDQSPDGAAVADAWSALWSEPDADARRTATHAVCHPDIAVGDDLMTLVGADALADHIGNAIAHMPGVTLRRSGPALATGATVTWPWILVGEPGVVGTGRSVATVDLDGRITTYAGFWEQDADDVSRRIHGMLPPLAPADHPELAGTDSATPELEPHLWASDLAAATDWYRDVLGFALDARFPEDGEPTWVRLTRGALALMIARIPPDADQIPDNQAYTRAVADRVDHGGPLALYLATADVDSAHDRAVTAGASVIEELWNPWWGGRQFTVEGPDGVWWTVTGEPKTT